MFKIVVVYVMQSEVYDSKAQIMEIRGENIKIVVDLKNYKKEYFVFVRNKKVLFTIFHIKSMAIIFNNKQGKPNFE